MKLGILVIVMKIMSSFAFENSSEGKETEKIFIAEGILKHHKYHKQNPEGIPSQNNDKANILPSNITPQNNIGMTNQNNNGSILFSSWVRYFKYRENDINISNTPKAFTVNNAYIEQGRQYPNININEKDMDGKSKYIKDKNSFWINVFSDTINIITSKQVFFHNVAKLSKYL
jgi:hypothetical protein